jgi:GT2 family glycosyltransferase/glycosyltransferase involved in cell wall biosynthesis
VKILLRDRLKARQGELLLSGLWLLGSIAPPLGLRKRYRGILIHLIKKTELFDRTYYLDDNPDVAQSAIPPLRHYVAYGDPEGRWPMPLFDPGYYRARVSGRTKSVNALLHYAYVGRYRLVAPSAWFDLRYYLANNKDVARSHQEPLRHYLRRGGLEGRSPNPQFDGAYYLHTNPDVREGRINPLIHYLQSGRFVERPTRHLSEAIGTATPGDDPATLVVADPWALFAPSPLDREPLVDVIVPAYKDHELTRRCLLSLLSARNATPFVLTVIEDASPDQALVEELEQLSARGLIDLRRHTRNLGFVATANEGMGLHTWRDVVLINADTEVYGDWLDRLRAVAYRYPRVATVTPLSNNATICSYPRFLHDNPFRLETDYATLDAMVARVNAGESVETPTGVGFCLYLRRDALNALGHFDAEAFGRGYGEENDYCQRAIRGGWQNLIATDIFVRHIGGASFQGEKGRLVANAMKLLARRYPPYHRDVDAFIRRDPLARARQRLDWERLKALAGDENVLIVCHNRGGGAERHVQEDTRQLRAEGKGVFYLRPDRARPTHVRLGHPDCRQLLNLPTHALADTEALAGLFRALRIRRVHSHGLIDFTADAPQRILALAHALDAPLDVDIHDYKVICPRVNLADRRGRYCGEPSEEHCDRCLAIEGNDFGATSIRDWRSLHQQVLKSSSQIWVPDADVATRLGRYYPDVIFNVLPHEHIAPSIQAIQAPSLAGDEPLRILVIGAIGKLKGYDVLLACARDARQRCLPLDYHLLGYSIKDEALAKAGVRITGRYLDQEAEARLDAIKPHVVWFPYTWPETYSYTLSLALRGGYPVFAFDLGAIARRARALNHPGELWPLSLADDPDGINDRFRAYRATAMYSTRDGGFEPVTLGSEPDEEES